MRQLAALTLSLVLALAWTVPIASADESAPARREKRGRSCTSIARQIAHYERIGDRARAQDATLVVRANEAHVERLRAYQARQCPQDVPPSLLQKVGRALQTIGEIGLTALTLGAL